MTNDTRRNDEAQWHGATAEELSAATKLALKLRPWEDRPGPAHAVEMTLGEMFFYVLSPHSDEPFLRGVLAMAVSELWGVYHEQNEQAVASGVLDVVGMIARRLEVAVELDTRFAADRAAAAASSKGSL